MDSNKTRARQRARFQERYDAFTAVQVAYEEARHLPRLATFRFDDATPMPRTLTVGSIALDFVCDVERITETALKDDEPSQQAWFRLLGDEQIEPKLAKSVIERCGGAYIRANVQPSRYFQPIIKRGSTGRRLA